MPFLELPLWSIALLNAIVIPVVSLTVSFLFLRIPANKFSLLSLTKAQKKKRAQFYEKVFFVKKWKHLLPNGAAFFQSAFSKQKFEKRSPEYFETFARESRRGELAHLVSFFFVAAFSCLYNPIWAIGVMFFAALGFNLPCYLVQRYNRVRLARKV